MVKHTYDVADLAQLAALINASLTDKADVRSAYPSQLTILPHQDLARRVGTK